MRIHPQRIGEYKMGLVVNFSRRCRNLVDRGYHRRARSGGAPTVSGAL